MGFLKHLLLIILTLLPISASAIQSWYLPQTNLFTDLWIENNNRKTIYVWIQTPTVTEGQSEISYELQSQERLAIPLQRFQKDSWLHIKAHDEDAVKVAVMSSSQKIYLKKDSSNQYADRVRSGGYLYLSNIYPYPVTSVVSYNLQQQTVTLEPNSTWQSPESLQAYSSVKVSSKNRLPAMVANKNFIQPLRFSAPSVLEPEDGAYFLLSNSRKSESFVVKITEPGQIKDARDQMQNLQRSKLLNGRILPGNQDFNRNWNHSNRAPWGWSVTEVNGFADFCHIDLDGSPSSVDQFLNLWMNKGGIICFWDYKIERELTAEQVATGRD